MVQHSTVFTIMLIDDDSDMNARLEKLLTGSRSCVGEMEMMPRVVRLDVELEEKKDQPGFWIVKDTTLRQLHALSTLPHYDLIIADFGFVPPAAQELLWGNDTSQQVTRDDASGRLLTIRDLRFQFEDWVRQTDRARGQRTNVFKAATRVIVRSFASRLMMDIFGPVVPNRVLKTQAAFPNATILSMDSRQELFGYDEFYDKYDRNFYRHLVGTYTTRVVESEMLRAAVRRSVFNIAAFAGGLAVVGGLAQYLCNIGIQLLEVGWNMGWWFLLAGLLTLVLGAMVLSLTFEWFARTVVRWIGPEEEFNRN